MVRSVATQAHEAILSAVAQAVDGADIQYIESRLHDVPTRRTVQRWLNDLVATDD